MIQNCENICDWVLDMNAISSPILSQIAFNYLSLSCGSCDVERAFSKFRDIQTTKRNSLSDKSINMYSVLNYNKDIQNNFMLF